jgi:outer membrane protein TolC
VSASAFKNGREYELDLVRNWLTESMREIQEELRLAREEEERTEEAIDSMERRYWEGQEDIASAYLERIVTRISEVE